MKSVYSLHASAEAVNFECTLLNKTASTEETSHRSRWKLCQLIDAGPLAERRKWPGVQSESKLKLHVVHSRSNARWILVTNLETSSLEALGMKTASRKLPKSLRLYSYTGCFFFFFFFFLPFLLFFFFFFAKKLTHKQVRPRNVVVLISQSFVCTVSWHWPRPARSAFFHNNVTWQYTLHIVT